MGCRTVMAKRQLVRIVRTADGVLVDPTGKLAGRGAYLHDRRSCWVAGMKGSLADALKVDLSANDREHLEAFMNTLGEAAPGE